MSPPKKKHIFLTLRQKSEILDKIEKGVSFKVICALYNIFKSTITKLKKTKKKYAISLRILIQFQKPVKL